MTGEKIYEWQNQFTNAIKTIKSELWWAEDSIRDMDHMSLNIDDFIAHCKALVTLWDAYEREYEADCEKSSELLNAIPGPVK